MVDIPAKTGPYLAFGKWLVEKRKAAGYDSQPQAELRARSRHLRLINQGKLTHIERGMNGNPDPEFLRQLATLYGLEYGTVVAEWIRVKYEVEFGAGGQKLSHPVQGDDTNRQRLPGQTDADRENPLDQKVGVGNISAAAPAHVQRTQAAIARLSNLPEQTRHDLGVALVAIGSALFQSDTGRLSRAVARALSDLGLEESRSRRRRSGAR